MKKIIYFILIFFISFQIFSKNDEDRIIFTKKDNYNFVETEYYSFYSSLSKSESRKILGYVNIFADKFIKIFDIDTPLKSTPLIRIFEEKKEFFKYVKDNDIKGVKYGAGFFSSKNNSIVVFYQGKFEDTLRTLVHEMSHYFVNHNFKVIPQALNEGFSTYFESADFRFHKISFGGLENSRYNDFYKMLKSNRYFPLNDFLKIRGYNLGHIDEIFGAEHYSEAFALVWYLLHSSMQNRESFKKYLSYVKNSNDIDGAAFLKIVANSPDFENNFKKFMSDSNLKTKKIKDLDL